MPALVARPGDTRRDVTVVIPARDEADRIGPCVRSIVGERTAVIVVDDGSSDDTRTVAEEAGARVVDAGPLPTGWAGKARALQIGLETAATPIVVSVDADCRATPGFVAAMAEALAGHALVTAGARVHSPDLGERLVHASMLATLVYRLGPPGVRAPRAHRTLANGQCMVFDRHAVLEAGGFTPVAGNLVEDIALARHLAGRGLPVAFLDATGILEVEGYGSALGTLRGWGRSLGLREVTSMPWMVADLAVVWAAMILPLPRLLSGRGDVVDAGGVVLRFAVGAATAGAFRPRGPALALSPLADLPVALRLTAGALRPSRTWRGRRY